MNTPQSPLKGPDTPAVLQAPSTASSGLKGTCVTSGRRCCFFGLSFMVRSFLKRSPARRQPSPRHALVVTQSLTVTPCLPCTAAHRHEVQPPLEQPPVVAAITSLTIGNGLPGIQFAAPEALSPALSAAADLTTS